MIRPALLLLGLVAAPAAVAQTTTRVSDPQAVAGMFGAMHAAYAPTTLEVLATAEVSRAPDLAELTAGVVTSAALAQPAMAENASRMAATVAALRRAGVADRDIQTSSLSLQPQYRYADGQPPQLIGYQASNQVRVTVRRPAEAGRLIDALVAAGANTVNGPAFRLSDPSAALDEARTKAVQTARARADLYARAAGLKVRRIASISEGGESGRPPIIVTAARRMSAEAMADTPVAPGEVELAVTLAVKFELEP